jgi:hypothetical protein
MGMSKTITIYCLWKRPDGKIISLRRVLKECSWRERSISTALQTGNVLNEPASIRIFCDKSGLEYIPPHEWYALSEDKLENYWTVDLERSALPLIVPFESDWTTDLDDESDITQAENDYIRETPGAIRVARRNDNRQGRGSHIRLQA